PGGVEGVRGVGRVAGVVETVVTGSIRPNAIEVLRAFGLDRYLDTEIGGYGSEVYPKGAMLLNARGRAAEKYRADFTEHTTVYIADSTRDVAAARVGGAPALPRPRGPGHRRRERTVRRGGTAGRGRRRRP